MKDRCADRRETAALTEERPLRWQKRDRCAERRETAALREERPLRGMM